MTRYLYPGSCLLELPDGTGAYYGTHESDPRRIDVMPVKLKRGPAFIAFVAGNEIGDYDTLQEAEQAAIAYLRGHPAPRYEE